MYILGISGGVRSGNHDPAAVLYQDGKLIAAVEEERLLRIKHAEGRLPENAVRYCLAQAGISIRDVAAVLPVDALLRLDARALESTHE